MGSKPSDYKLSSLFWLSLLSTELLCSRLVNSEISYFLTTNSMGLNKQVSPVASMIKLRRRFNVVVQGYVGNYEFTPQ